MSDAFLKFRDLVTSFANTHKDVSVYLTAYKVLYFYEIAPSRYRWLIKPTESFHGIVLFIETNSLNEITNILFEWDEKNKVNCIRANCNQQKLTYWVREDGVHQSSSIKDIRKTNDAQFAEAFKILSSAEPTNDYVDAVFSDFEFWKKV